MSPTPQEICGGGRLFKPDTLARTDPLRGAIDQAAKWIDNQFTLAANAHINSGTLTTDAFPAGLIVEQIGQTGINQRIVCLHPVYGQPDRSSRSRQATLYAAASINYSLLFPLQPVEDPHTKALIGYNIPWTNVDRKNRISPLSPRRLSSGPPGLYFIAEVSHPIQFTPLLQEIIAATVPHRPSTDQSQSLRQQLAAWEMLQLAVYTTALIPPPRPTFK